MPASDDDRYYRTLLSAVQDMSETLGTVREQMSRDLADYMARYREDVSRSINALHYRVKDVEDAAARRQAHLDAKLATIETALARIDRAGTMRGAQIWALIALMVILVVVLWLR